MIFLRGMAMGAADIVPGVSGGTVAFITGIYQRLINAIKSFDKNFFSLIFNRDFIGAWRHVDGIFLVLLGAGIAISIITLSRSIKYLLIHESLLLWSFFWGLIVASAFVMAKEIKKWNGVSVLCLSAGVVIAYFISVISPTETPESYWFIFASGAIAICAMILPGISGSFLLVLMGKYAFILGTISSTITHLKSFDVSALYSDLLVLAVFSSGCLVGLLSFSKVVAWILRQHWDIAVSLLMGFMIGSLNKVWPWKEVLKTHLDRHGNEKPLLEKSILPETYANLGGDPQLSTCLISMAVGFLLVLIINQLAIKLSLAVNANNDRIK